MKFTLWRNWGVVGYDADADLPQIREAYEDFSQSHHCHFLGVEIGEDLVLEGFQWITSDEKLLSSCAVFTTVTSTSTSTPTDTTASISTSTTTPYLQHNTPPSNFLLSSFSCGGDTKQSSSFSFSFF